MSVTPELFIHTRQLCKKVALPGNTLNILTDINLTINRGDSVAIVGASGSGKSTLLGLLAGLDVPTSGNVVLAGEAIDQLNDDQRASLRAQHVGFVFQSFLLLPALSALENVTLPAELAGQANAKERGQQLLERVGLAQRMHFFPSQLSGGEQQRVAIARAFITQPEILFADEPSANLDSATGKKVEDLLFELNESLGTTLVLVTHNPQLAARCGRQFLMDAGRLHEAGVAAQELNYVG